MREVFEKILPPERILTDPESLAAYGKDWLRDFAPRPSAILLPISIEEVRRAVALCNDQRIAIVLSGGRTGLSGGATATSGEVVLSLSKLNRIYEVDAVERTVRCEAGAVTEKVQQTALEAGLYFPVDFASKGSSQIGGNIATNAGGIRVIKYGNIREWVLGLKVVTPTGQLLELNGSLFKNQTGYDLRSLFVGSEGTLGVIVEATLKLTVPPGDIVRVLCGFADLTKVLEMLSRVRRQLRSISAFELFPESGLAKVIEHHRLRDPFSRRYPSYVVFEIEKGAEPSMDDIEECVSSLMEDGIVEDAVISQNTRQAAELMALRELLSETLSARHVLHKNDISVPIGAIPAFVSALDETVRGAYPGFEVVTFGHVGDGNLHVNILKPGDMEDAKFYDYCHAADRDLFSLVERFRGSVSAEHGVGLLKKEFLGYSRSSAEIECMKAIKRAFDPNGIMNPGKIFDLS